MFRNPCFVFRILGQPVNADCSIIHAAGATRPLNYIVFGNQAIFVEARQV